jgi:predicted DNA-binding transcriptional regulator YafY
VRLIVAWCELRRGFRNFRTDRITASEFLDETYAARTADLRAAWWREEQARRADQSSPAPSKP